MNFTVFAFPVSFSIHSLNYSYFLDFQLPITLVPSGASFGDPHILTFDAVEYTFNGFGEYTVLSVNNSQFVLQGRMQPLNGGHNGKSPATVFTAFAMKQQGGSLIQVSHYAPYCKSHSVPIA